MSAKSVTVVIVLALVVLLGVGCGPSALLIQPVSGAKKLTETVIHRDKGFVTDKIAVIDIDGVMTNAGKQGWFSSSDNPVSLFVEKLDKAQDDHAVKAVVLRLNSPGGSVGAADTMYHKLRQFKDKCSKPVVACMLDVAASGAYYLACGCDGIVAQPSTVTGSIGTIMQTMSFEGTMQKLGIKAVAIKSGQLKDMASPLHDLTDREREVLHGVVTALFEQFVKVVDDGRKGLDEQQVRALADGRVFTAREAVEKGLIDRIGYPDDGVAWAKKMAGVEKAKVVMYHRPYNYTPNVYSTEAKAGCEAGMLINVQLPDWLNGTGTQFLYLWQSGLAQ